MILASMSCECQARQALLARDRIGSVSKSLAATDLNKRRIGITMSTIWTMRAPALKATTVQRLNAPVRKATIMPQVTVPAAARLARPNCLVRPATIRMLASTLLLALIPASAKRIVAANASPADRDIDLVIKNPRADDKSTAMRVTRIPLRFHPCAWPMSVATAFRASNPSPNAPMRPMKAATSRSMANSPRAAGPRLLAVSGAVMRPASTGAIFPAKCKSVLTQDHRRTA